MDLANANFPQEIGHKLSGRENLDNRARIFAMVTNVDDNMGRLFKHLDKLEITDNTLVIFLVDNGPNGNRYVAGFKGNKTTVREGGIRSPALLHYPEKLKAGWSVDKISAHIDLPPTILEACGVKTDSRDIMDGRSLWPLLTGKKMEWSDRSIVIQAHRGAKPVLYHNFALRNQRWKLLHASGFQSENFSGQPQFELYDMQKDPLEMNNLANKRPEVLARLKADYLSWFADVSNTRPDNYDSPRIYIDPEFENPVVLTRQDGEHFKGKPFGRDSVGIWRLKVIKPTTYSIRYRFAALEEKGTAILNLYGRKYTVPVSKGKTEVIFRDIRLRKGAIDLLPMLKVGDEQFSPWKIDIAK
jgi:arylsulfatase/arylsulfatase A